MNFDFLKFDITKIDLSKIDLSKINLNNAKSLKIILVVFLVIIFGLDLCVVLPLTRNINQARREQIIQSNEIGSASKMLFQETRLVKNHLIWADNPDEMFDKMSALAQMNNIELKINTTLNNGAKTSPEDAYARKIFHVDASGTFKNLGIFLGYVRDMREAILDVDSIDLSRNAMTPSIVDGHINFTVFINKDEENQ